MVVPRALSTRAVRLAIVLGIAIAADACAASASFTGGLYRDAHVAFQLEPVPSGWRPIRVSDADLAFRDDAHEASVMIHGSCIPDEENTPLPSLTAHLIMGTTDRRFIVEETLPLDARDARHTVLQAKLDGVLMAYDIFVLKKNGCVYDLVYVGEPDDVDQGAPAFEQIARSFRTIRGGET